MAKKSAEKSFVVIDGDLRLLIERGEKMYIASSLDIRGLNTQGKTIEEVIENAHDAAKVLAEYRASEIEAVKAASKKVVRSKVKATNTTAVRKSGRKIPAKV